MTDKRTWQPPAPDSSSASVPTEEHFIESVIPDLGDMTKGGLDVVNTLPPPPPPRSEAEK